MKLKITKCNSLSKTTEKGFSVVELMIAMVLGLMLTVGISKVYLTTKDTYNLSENLARLQENARFAMNYLTQDIRLAGFIPCRVTGDVSNSINSTDGFFDFPDQSLFGYEGGVSTFGSEFPAVGTNPGDRVAGTDAVVILRGDNEVYKVTQHNPTSAQFKVNDLHTMDDGDIAMICDGTESAIFQVTNVNSSNVTMVHNTGTGSPGNCNVSLGGSYDCTDTTNAIQYPYGTNAQLVKFTGAGYFIGVSSNGTSRSLYRRRLSIDNGTTSATFIIEELLQGIENLQILYGEDTDGDAEPEQFLTANNVTTWLDVVAVKVGLLAHTEDQISKINDTNSYNVSGTQIADTGTTITHDGDQRLRYVFNTSIKLRNRGLN